MEMILELCIVTMAVGVCIAGLTFLFMLVIDMVRDTFGHDDMRAPTLPRDTDGRLELPRRKRRRYDAGCNRYRWVD